MRILTLLNRDGGTLKTADVDAFAEYLRAEFDLHGHEIEVRSCSGGEIVPAIEKAVQQEAVEVLLVGGGDGTVSAAVERLFKTDTILGILPAGTMNLFARSLQIPLNLELAVPALAAGVVTSVDVATANGQPFCHQYALGLHARVVRIRKNIPYGSRIGKILATTRAVYYALRRLPKMELVVRLDDEEEMALQATAFAVSNNVYGEGHAPFAENPVGGRLGVYYSKERNPTKLAKLAVDVLRGIWRGNPSLKVTSAQRVRIQYKSRRSERRSVLDGELRAVAPETEIRIHPGALRVLVPADATFLK